MTAWLHLPVLLVMMVAELPLLTCGLMCECTADCAVEKDTCDAGARGACYSQLITDISGQRTVLRKGCVTDAAQSVICAYTDSSAHKNLCCNDTDSCNAEHFQETQKPQETACRCVGSRRCKNQKCTLRSNKDSCYTTIRRLGTVISYERGCIKKCTESHSGDEKTTCCRGDLCNNEKIPNEWPSPSSPTSMTATTSYIPQLIGNTASPQQTGMPTKPDTGIIDIPIFPTTEEPTATEIDLRRPGVQFMCHCSQCTDGPEVCETDYACASYSMGDGIHTTSCVHAGVQGEFTCTNKSSFNITCCFSNYCNRPSPTTPGRPGPPCDDEDTEQSGCEPLVITSTPSTIKTTSTRSTMTSTVTPSTTTRASPPLGREHDTDDDNHETIVVFYMFIVLLCICVVIMVAVLILCGVIVYYYRHLISKQTLSSATVLESSMKEKSFTSSSPS